MTGRSKKEAERAGCPQRSVVRWAACVRDAADRPARVCICFRSRFALRIHDDHHLSVYLNIIQSHKNTIGVTHQCRGITTYPIISKQPRQPTSNNSSNFNFTSLIFISFNLPTTFAIMLFSIVNIESTFT